MDDVLLSSAGGWRHISNRIDQSAAKYLDQRAGAAFNFAFFSNVFGGVGGMLSLVITQPLVDLLTKTFGREVVAWRIVTMGYMLLALMSISLVVSATKEKDRQFMESGVEPYQLKDLLPLLRENHPLQMLAIAVATNDLATGMQNATLVYFSCMSCIIKTFSQLQLL